MTKKAILAIAALAVVSTAPTRPAFGYHFFEANMGGCRWPATGPGNVDFVVDGSSTSTIGAMLLAEVTSAREAWNSIATAQPVLGNFSSGTVDFTDANFGTAWGAGPTQGTSDGQNEVVLDETGDIFRLLGLDPSRINGFGPSRREVSSGTCVITDAFNLLNGVKTDFDRASTTVHEFGHIQGLAHSSVGQYNSRNNTAFTSARSGSPSSALRVINIGNVPTMHPFSSGTGSARRSPEQDDIAGLSELYPSADATSLGSIEGTVTKCEDGSPLQGVNVRAVSRTNSQLQVSRYSAFDSNGVGRYLIGGLPPGAYDVLIEPMGYNGFTTGRMAIKTSLSTGFATEFFGPTADQETACSEAVPDTPAVVTVAAGATTSNINVRVQETRLAFVVDDTGSMGNEISAVRDSLNQYVSLLEARGIPFPRVAFITFKDNVVLRTVTSNPDELRTIINGLTASGGGDCPESSNAALLDAAKVLNRGGVAILYTDADSRPNGPTDAAVLNFFRRNGIRLNVLLSATCAGGFSSVATAPGNSATGGSDPEHRRQAASNEDPEASVSPASAARMTSSAQSPELDEFDEPEPLGFENALTTFSQLTSDTLGILVTTPRPISGDNRTAYINASTNLSVSSVVPAIGALRPQTAPQGATLQLEIVGANTNWTTDSVVEFSSPGIMVNAVEVASATSIVATVSIPTSEPIGFVDITVTSALAGGVVETAQGVGAFRVQAPTGGAQILSVIPDRASAGSTVELVIGGINTAFDGTSLVQVGFSDPAITVDSIVAESPTQIRAMVALDGSAAPGFRTVSVTTGAEIATSPNGFLVTPVPAPLPRLVAVEPAEGPQGGQGIEISIVGENTNFVEGGSQASVSGDGITNVRTTVISPTQANLTIDIAPDATLGVRDVSVTTADENAVLLNGFRITEEQLTIVPLPRNGRFKGCLEPGDSIGYSFAVGRRARIEELTVLGVRRKARRELGRLAPSATLLDSAGTEIFNRSASRFLKIRGVRLRQTGDYTLIISGREMTGGCFKGTLELREGRH